MITKIENCNTLIELTKIIMETDKLTYLEKQDILNDLKYGSEEYINKFKDKIIKILKQKEINK